MQPLYMHFPSIEKRSEASKGLSTSTRQRRQSSMAAEQKLLSHLYSRLHSCSI